MNSFTSHLHRNLYYYWHRRTYQILDASSPPGKKLTTRLGGGRRRRKNRRLWKLHRVQPVLKMSLKFPSLVKLLGRLRSACTDGMAVLAGGEVMRSSAVMKCGRGKAALEQRVRCASAGRGEFEKRKMLHVCNSILALRELISLVDVLCLKERDGSHVSIAKT